jgi:pre-rRNA-processing protein TSR2
MRHSLSEWPALQIAIEQGMGGADAPQKQTWMAQVIYDFLLLNKHVVDEDELHDYISDIMDNEFDTIVDDGSMSLLTRRIAFYCKLQLESKESELLKILEKKRNEKPAVAPQIQPELPSVPSATTATTADSGDKNADDDEWTVVSRKSNRRT